MKEKLKKVLKIIAAIALLVFLIFAGLMVYNYIRIQRGDLIKWEGRYYTKEALKEHIPPQYYEAPSKNTPEETYTAFRQALLDNNIEAALGYITMESRERYREMFEDEEKLGKFIDIPSVESLRKEHEIGNYSSYYYYEESQIDDIPFNIYFIKDYDGYWKIDSI